MMDLSFKICIFCNEGPANLQNLTVFHMFFSKKSVIGHDGIFRLMRHFVLAEKEHCRETEENRLKVS